MRLCRPRRGQSGAALIEFALGLLIFLTFFLGVIDFARMLWTWGAAKEATRLGARISVVCNKDASAVPAGMRRFLPQLRDQQVQVQWYGKDGPDPTCTPHNCTAVSVRITELDHLWISPIGWAAGRTIAMPQFASFLPRESMGRDPDSRSVCEVPTGA